MTVGLNHHLVGIHSVCAPIESTLADVWQYKLRRHLGGVVGVIVDIVKVIT